MSSLQVSGNEYKVRKVSTPSIFLIQLHGADFYFQYTHMHTYTLRYVYADVYISEFIFCVVLLECRPKSHYLFFFFILHISVPPRSKTVLVIQQSLQKYLNKCMRMAVNYYQCFGFKTKIFYYASLRYLIHFTLKVS